MAACPAELPPPITATSCPVHRRDSTLVLLDPHQYCLATGDTSYDDRAPGQKIDIPRELVRLVGRYFLVTVSGINDSYGARFDGVEVDVVLAGLENDLSVIVPVACADGPDMVHLRVV